MFFFECVRLEVEIPIIMVGSIFSYGDVNAILVSGRVDLCALVCVHLMDPYWMRYAVYE